MSNLKYKYKAKAIALKLNMQGSKKLGKVLKTSDGITTEIDAVLHKEFIEELVGVETTISNSSIGAQHLKHAYKYFQYKEEFVALFLDRQNRVIGWHNASKGGATSVTVDIKQILGIAAKINAQGLIISHNHPSGILTPSQADLNLTKQFIQAGKLLDIAVLDHVIVALAPDKEGKDEFKYRSLREQGDINQW
jgi:DNA repair protein RadC